MGRSVFWPSVRPSGSSLVRVLPDHHDARVVRQNRRLNLCVCARARAKSCCCFFGAFHLPQGGESCSKIDPPSEKRESRCRATQGWQLDRPHCMLATAERVGLCTCANNTNKLDRSGKQEEWRTRQLEPNPEEGTCNLIDLRCYNESHSFCRPAGRPTDPSECWLRALALVFGQLSRTLSETLMNEMPFLVCASCSRVSGCIGNGVGHETTKWRSRETNERTNGGAERQTTNEEFASSNCVPFPLSISPLPAQPAFCCCCSHSRSCPGLSARLGSAQFHSVRSLARWKVHTATAPTARADRVCS